MTALRTVPQRLRLTCEVVEVPHGLRLLCPDGHSFLLRGTDREALTEGRLPADILGALARLGLVRTEPRASIAVVGSGTLAADVSEAVRAVPGALVVELGDGTGRPRPGGTWPLLGEAGSHLRPDLVVVCPRDPLGLREPVHLCQDRGLPVVVGWAGSSGAWLGPVALPSRPGCQDCLDAEMARRDPLWAHTAAGLVGSAPGWAPRRWLAERLARLVADGPQDPDWVAPTWASWTARGNHQARLDPLPDCPRCRLHHSRPAPLAA